MKEAFDAWLAGLSEGWWDDAFDAHGILDSLQEAFEAGWAAGRNENEPQVS